VAVASRAWLLVSVSAAGGTPALRMYVWRALRGLGVVPIGPSVHLLPDLDAVDRKVHRLVARVMRDGGTAQIWHIHVSSKAEHDQLVAQVQAARDEEYAEVLDRLPAFFTELETETVRGRITFAEVEENEADLARFRSWLAKIAARDYFTAPAGQQARAEVARAEAALATFEAAAISAEETSPNAARPRLRSIPAG